MSEPFLADPRGLTSSEQQLLALIREGRVDAEIAVRLGISNAEVKSRVEQLARRMGASDRSALKSPMAPFDPKLSNPPVREAPRPTANWWTAAAAALALVVLALTATVILVWDESPAAPAAEVSLAPLPSVTPTVATPTPPTLSIVLGGREMLDAGQLFTGQTDVFQSSVGVIAAQTEVRESLLVVRLAKAGVIRYQEGPVKWTLVGGGTHLVALAGNVGTTTYSVFLLAEEGTEFIYGDDDSIGVYSRGTGGPTVVVWAQSQVCNCEYHVELLADGHLYVSTGLLPFSAPVAYDTGELLNLEGMRPFGSAGRDDHWTRCGLTESGVCEAILRYDYKAPYSGTLKCEPASGVLEYSSSDVVLRLRRTDGVGLSCREASREVVAGEALGYGNNFDVTATSSEGLPLSVVITREGLVYVGDVSPKFGCPCRSGN